MASLELRNHTYRVVFRYAGRKYGYSLDTGDRQTAEGLRGGVERTLMLIEQKVLRVPEGADVVAFVKAGGQPEEEPRPLSPSVSSRPGTWKPTATAPWRPAASRPCACTWATS